MFRTVAKVSQKGGAKKPATTNPSGGRRRTALHDRANERAATFEGLPAGVNQSLMGR